MQRKLLVLLFIILLCSSTYARTIVVGRSSKSDHFYIKNAVNVAKDGDVIIVKPGTYYENTIRVNHKNIEIIGSGYDSTKIIYTGDWVSFYFKDVTNGKLSGFDISPKYPKSQTLILLQHSNIIIENNKIHNAYNLHGISITDNSNPLIRNNIIFDNEEVGINISHSTGNVYYNEIYNNKLYGISISDSSNPTIFNNTVYENKKIGIIVMDSKGKIEGNECYNNKMYGISSNESSARIIGNKLHTNKIGIFLINSRGEASENECYNNKLHGISIDNSNPDIRKNIIYNNKQAGIVLRKSNGNIYENIIYKNELHGISATRSSKPLIYNNTIYHNKFVGIQSSKKSCPIVKNNIVVRNTIGIGAVKGGDAKLIKNLVWGNTSEKHMDYIGKDYTGIKKGKTDISADPLFLDEDNYDFRLKLHSPAIGVGEGGRNLGAIIYQEIDGENQEDKK